MYCCAALRCAASHVCLQELTALIAETISDHELPYSNSQEHSQLKTMGQGALHCTALRQSTYATLPLLVLLLLLQLLPSCV